MLAGFFLSVSFGRVVEVGERGRHVEEKSWAFGGSGRSGKDGAWGQVRVSMGLFPRLFLSLSPLINGSTKMDVLVRLRMDLFMSRIFTRDLEEKSIGNKGRSNLHT